MRLSLSARILETNLKDKPFDYFLAMARDAGYDAVGLRAWQIPDATDTDAINKIKSQLETHGLTVSSITAGKPDSVAGVLPLARALNVSILQSSGTAEQLATAATQLDPGMRVGPQMHTGGPFEDVPQAAKTLSTIDAPAVGVVVEPANIVFTGASWSESCFAPIADRIIGCNLQSIVAGDGEASVKLNNGKIISYRRVPLADNPAMDFTGFLRELKAAGYDDFINVIEPFSPEISPEKLAAQTAEYLRTELARMFPE